MDNVLPAPVLIRYLRRRQIALTDTAEDNLHLNKSVKGLEARDKDEKAFLPSGATFGTTDETGQLYLRTSANQLYIPPTSLDTKRPLSGLESDGRRGLKTAS